MLFIMQEHDTLLSLIHILDIFLSLETANKMISQTLIFRACWFPWYEHFTMSDLKLPNYMKSVKTELRRYLCSHNVML